MPRRKPGRAEDGRSRADIQALAPAGAAASDTIPHPRTTAMLVVFGGLPGTGKTTIARAVAERCRSTYLRIDTIEMALWSTNVADDVGPAGYVIAYALAEANLKLGQIVVADSVNPVTATRTAWRAAAAAASSRILEVEIVCSDAAEHRRRVENRTADIPGLVPPTWAEVVARDYEPWPEPHFVIDTTRLQPAEAVATIIAAIAERAPGRLRPS
jgi:predicted kinase